MKTVTVKLPDALANWLSEGASALGRPQSELIRDALERLRKGDDSISCHNLMSDVCGVIKGPKDLSTNPQHMDGFGC